MATSVIRHIGQTPSTGDRTFGCIGHQNRSGATAAGDCAGVTTCICSAAVSSRTTQTITVIMLYSYEQ